MKLQLGCGHAPKAGWVNHDLVKLPGVDVVHDLREFPWPFRDQQFDEIYMKDVLEHLPDTIRTMDELYRITAPNALVYIAVPYWNSFEAIGDPTHLRQFNEITFDFFDPDSWRCRDRSYYAKARFRVERLGFALSPFQPVFRIPRLHGFNVFNPAAKTVLRALASVFNNVIIGLEVYLRRA
jgi:SAM-dependent methyltransferase